MKKSFTRFWRRNLAFSKLAILTNLEYRLNFFTDTVVQPVLTALIEVTLWIAVFKAAGTTEIGGFGKEYYLSYVLWASFIARTTANWSYEFKMIDEIESGSVNGLLVRPMSFFEYYLSQFLGYKFITSFFSFMVPFAVIFFAGLPTDFSKLPIAVVLVTYYVIFLHMISFCIASLAFHLNRVHSFTVAKNLAMWLLSGELIPLDLIPSPYKDWLLALPFSNAVYRPVGYITGRISWEVFAAGFTSITISIAFTGLLCIGMWRWGLSRYVGTGA